MIVIKDCTGEVGLVDVGMVHLSTVLVDKFSLLSVIIIQEFVCLDFLSKLASNAVQCVTKSSFFSFIYFHWFELQRI